jgi:hypothetical protein
MRDRQPLFAQDYASVRTFDRDGRLRVAVTNISKANVCPYIGREIPGWDALGLDPDRTYRLYRDPEELEKAAETFNNIPVLAQHVRVSADDHRPEEVVGATGSDARFDAPYLTNSMIVWAAAAIKAIENSSQREISAAYRYEPDMTSGRTPDGEAYDGVMRNLNGNHVALVTEGRAGPDVIVADGRVRDVALSSYFQMFPHARRLKA